MKLILALLAGAVGLVVTASAVMLIWFVLQNKNKQEKAIAPETSPWSAASTLLLQWTYFDYAIVGVFAVGSLFLFTDVIAVIRDAQSYPLYHYGYLVCGFVFTLLAMLFMVFRFAAMLAVIRSGGTVPTPDEHTHPSEADQAE